ncbi:UNVERIFIED_ORG: hypothetical protein J2Y78_004911 [Buttiauxella agrestis ATCC 33320]
MLMRYAGGLEFSVTYSGITAGEEVRVHFEVTGQVDPVSPKQVLPTQDFSHTVTSTEAGGTMTFTVPESEMIGSRWGI